MQRLSSLTSSLSVLATAFDFSRLALTEVMQTTIDPATLHRSWGFVISRVLFLLGSFVGLCPIAFSERDDIRALEDRLCLSTGLQAHGSQATRCLKPQDCRIGDATKDHAGLIARDE
jgi:hypothetical protein